MNKEIVFVIEPDAGRVTVEISQVAKQAVDEIAGDLGNRVNLNCAKPAEKDRYLPILQTDFTSPSGVKSDPFSIWLYRVYHNSVVDGPGRRSVIQTAGCSIKCRQCLVPQTHQSENGKLVTVSSIVTEVVARREKHDGVTILGGEPFDQAGPVAELVSRLKRHGLHLTIYSGYTFETLIGRKDPNIDFILTHIDLLIDGPFVRQLAQNSGEYRGSRNQRLIVNPGDDFSRPRSR